MKPKTSLGINSLIPKLVLPHSFTLSEDQLISPLPQNKILHSGIFKDRICSGTSEEFRSL